MTDCSFPQEKHPFFSRHPGLASALILVGLLLFGFSVYSLITHSLLYLADQRVSAFFVPLGKRLPAGLMTALIWLANISSLTPNFICLGLCYYWLRKKCDQRFVLVLASYGVGILTFWVLALLFDRQRPSLPGLLAAVPFPSFPSGHMIQNITLLVPLLYLYLPRVASPRARAAWLAAGLAFVALIGADRLLTNAHYLTDVLAGAGLALAWAVTVLLLMERAHQRQPQRSPVPARGEDITKPRRAI